MTTLAISLILIAVLLALLVLFVYSAANTEVSRRPRVPEPTNLEGMKL